MVRDETADVSLPLIPTPDVSPHLSSLLSSQTDKLYLFNFLHLLYTCHNLNITQRNTFVNLKSFQAAAYQTQ
jgi:hypothetical protein